MLLIQIFTLTESYLVHRYLQKLFIRKPVSHIFQANSNDTRAKEIQNNEFINLFCCQLSCCHYFNMGYVLVKYKLLFCTHSHTHTHVLVCTKASCQIEYIYIYIYIYMYHILVLILPQYEKLCTLIFAAA